MTSPTAPRTAPVVFVNYAPSSSDEMRDMCDVWLASICSAGWSTKEAHRVAAFIASCLYGNRTAELYMRDVESALNIQPEESQRALKLLKLFGAIEDAQVERGKITVDVRVSLEQKLRLAEARATLRRLEASEQERAMTAGIAALRAVSGHAKTERYAFDDAELARAIGEG